MVEIECRHGKNSASICCPKISFFFLTMASRTGCEILNTSEVAGSILTVFPTKVKKKGKSHVPRNCKTHSLKNNDESNTIIAESLQ